MEMVVRLMVNHLQLLGGLNHGVLPAALRS